MLRPLVICALLSALASPVLGGDAQAEARDWVKRMAHAVKTTNYEGTFVYLHGNHMDSMRLIHTIEEGEVCERLVSLNGAVREVIRKKDSVISIDPHSRAVSVAKRRGNVGAPALSEANLDELSAYYEFRLIGGDRVAGRPVRVLLVRPRDAYRYGYRLSLDLERALPLMTEMLDESGQNVAQFMFTNFTVDPDLDQESPSLMSMAKKEGFSWRQESSGSDGPLTGGSDWLFNRLPVGFQLQLRTEHKGPAEDNRIEHFVFSDGLATFSVYAEKGGPNGGLQGGSRMGAVNAFGKQLGNHHITVVGEVPGQTVQEIAEGMEYRASRASQ